MSFSPKANRFSSSQPGIINSVSRILLVTIYVGDLKCVPVLIKAHHTDIIQTSCCVSVLRLSEKDKRLSELQEELLQLRESVELHRKKNNVS